MIGVKQTIFGDRVGNCFAACIASLLELPVDDVVIDPGDAWLESTQEYLKAKGLFFLEVRIDVAVNYPLYELRDVWVIYSGKSPRGNFNHAVVGKLNMAGLNVAYEMVHDPHPDNAFLAAKPFGIGFLVPLNPRLEVKP